MVSDGSVMMMGNYMLGVGTLRIVSGILRELVAVVADRLLDVP